ncbi:hypothetical protein BDV36DRAFT_271847 [Aspergillus pseudocaelatus]|uniref:Uncharacterized protein n=1 Tax=Aspergillus pseudocaelatus TaxID=1825620 RepID=A0ABQ6W5D2_9EURO|nr:hypothetical protein BDV36DRAFT_271847 [Aspergillus pseudocaelatus]
MYLSFTLSTQRERGEERGTNRWQIMEWHITSLDLMIDALPQLYGISALLLFYIPTPPPGTLWAAKTSAKSRQDITSMSPCIKRERERNIPNFPLLQRPLTPALLAGWSWTIPQQRLATLRWLRLPSVSRRTRQEPSDFFVFLHSSLLARPV